ncbi:hypothetical protein YC2023_099077 [Brassica napus]
MVTMMTKLLRLSTVSGKFQHKMRQATPYSGYLYLKDSQFSEVDREEYQFRTIGTVLDNGTQLPRSICLLKLDGYVRPPPRSLPNQ